MKTVSLFTYGLVIVAVSALTASCTCHDDESRQQKNKEQSEPGKVPPSPDLPEPPRNTGAPTS